MVPCSYPIHLGVTENEFRSFLNVDYLVREEIFLQ